jgi:hypothetical protein
MGRVLEGKCYYRQQGWWTYEFCYKSHVRQFHMDMNTKKITEEYMLGYYNASNSFEARNSERLGKRFFSCVCLFRSRVSFSYTRQFEEY